MPDYPVNFVPDEAPVKFIPDDQASVHFVPDEPTVSERPYLPSPSNYPRTVKPPLNEFEQERADAKSKIDEAARAPLTTGEASAVAIGEGLNDLFTSMLEPKNLAIGAGLTALTAFPPTAPIGVLATAALGAKMLGESAGTATAALEQGDIPGAVRQIPAMAASGLMLHGAPGEAIRSGKAALDRFGKEETTTSTSPPPPPQTKDTPSGETTPATGSEPSAQDLAPNMSAGPGAASPVDFEAPNKSVTGIRNAVTDTERQQRGLPPVTPVVRRDFGTVWDDAIKQIDEHPEYQDELINQLRDNPRALTDTEDAVLLQRQIDLQNEFDKAQRDIVTAQESGDEAGKFEAYTRFNGLSDQLLDLYNIGKKVGTETGRGLNARRMMANEDFSLASMITEKRAANQGRTLTPQELTEIQTLKSKLDATQAAFDEYKAAAERRAAEDAASSAINQMQAPDPLVARIVSRIGSFLEDQAGSARERMRARAGTTFAGLDPTVLSDLAIIGADHIFKGAVDFGKWSSRMIDEFGDAIRPHLEDIFKASNDQIDKQIDSLAPKNKKVRHQVSATTEATSQAETLTDRLKTAKSENAPPEQLGGLIQKIAKTFVAQGIKEREALIDAVHNVVKDIVPEMSRRDTMDAISGYGKFKQLSKEEVDVQLRELKGEMQQLGKIEDMEAGIAPKKTGVERRTPSDEERGLIKKVNELKKKLGFTVTDPATQLRSALDSIKTRLRNQITDLELQISRRTKTVKDKTEAPTDAEVESLRARRDDLKNEFDSIFGKPELTEAQRIERATKAVQRSLDEYERQLREGTPAKSKKPAVNSPELEAMRARRDGLKEMLSLLREGPKKSPEEISLQAFKTRTANRIADLKERIAQGDFTKETRKPIQFDEEALKLKAENERLKNEFKAGVERDRLSNRSKAQIAFDTFLKWRRGFVLSGIRTLGKLTDAAILRMISGPVEDILGSAIGKVVPSLASKARLEGTFRPSAEVKGITEALTQGMKDAWETLTKGESSLGVVYGKTRVMDRSFVDFFGRLHGALKAPVKRAEFARAFQKLSLFDQEHGIDITDPLVQTRNAIEAYRYANRQIFLQDNALVSAYKAALKTLETKKGETGKPSAGAQAIAGTAKLLLPIVRVPTNLVAETAEYAVGSVTGSVKLGLIAKRGIETMTEAEANLVLRQLKKGSLGLAFMLIGFFNPELIPMGGYFQRGQKREKDAVPYGAARLYGVDVPRSMIEHPAIEASQIGATVRNVSDSKMRKNGDEQGITAGLMAGALGLVEEAPFMREMIGVSKSFDPHTRTEFLGEMAKGILIPQLLQQLASFMDKDPEGNPVVRHPTTFVEHLKTGIPGLRSSVPEKGETGKLKTLKSK